MTLHLQKPEVILRAFRAIDDQASCELFVEGHAHVLESIGVKKVTSSSQEWIYNPTVFVLVVESSDRKKVYGGARVNVAGGSQLLPIEEATGYLDAKIYDLVKQHAKSGTGEICGLWNSREIAGFGIGSIFLTRAAVAITQQIGVQSLFALCAPYTVQMAKDVGYEIDTSVGNNGTFYYPKLDLVATTMILDNVKTLLNAKPEDREAIHLLRDNMNVVKTEVLRRKEIEINYQLAIPGLDQWNLAEYIKKSQVNTFVK